MLTEQLGRIDAGGEEYYAFDNLLTSTLWRQIIVYRVDLNWTHRPPQNAFIRINRAHRASASVRLRHHCLHKEACHELCLTAR